MTDSTMANFIGLSAVLTGFSAKILSPTLDPVDIKSEYLPFFTQAVTQESGNPDLVNSIFQKFSSLKAQKLSDQQIGEAMLADSNGADFVIACRKLIFMWYAGAWPTLIPASDTAPANTVSNMMFSYFQFSTAQQIGLSVDQSAIVVALQAVGGAAGNMICVHNVVAASATVGLLGREGDVIRMTIRKCGGNSRPYGVNRNPPEVRVTGWKRSRRCEPMDGRATSR